MAEEIQLSDRNVPRTPLHEELTRLYSQGYMTVIRKLFYLSAYICMYSP